MNRPVSLALTLLAVGPAALHTPAQAATFGGLTITPRGPQNLNLETGLTELPQGGTATDQKWGLKLSAGRLEFAPGKTLRASAATLTTRQGGTLRANQVVYDLGAGTVRASGNLSYSDARLKDLGADTLTLNVRTGFVTAAGDVRARVPALSAPRLVFDPSTQQAVLAGPYRAAQGTLNARGDAGDRLLLIFGPTRVISASTAPDAETLRRFGPYLK